MPATNHQRRRLRSRSAGHLRLHQIRSPILSLPTIPTRTPIPHRSPSRRAQIQNLPSIIFVFKSKAARKHTPPFNPPTGRGTRRVKVSISSRLPARHIRKGRCAGLVTSRSESTGCKHTLGILSLSIQDSWSVYQRQRLSYEELVTTLFQYRALLSSLSIDTLIHMPNLSSCYERNILVCSSITSYTKTSC
jgi:hypothetical protein